MLSFYPISGWAISGLQAESAPSEPEPELLEEGAKSDFGYVWAFPRSKPKESPKEPKKAERIKRTETEQTEIDRVAQIERDERIGAGAFVGQMAEAYLRAKLERAKLEQARLEQQQQEALQQREATIARAMESSRIEHARRMARDEEAAIVLLLLS